MSTTIILHTENKDNLHKFFKYFNQKFKKNDFDILVHSKDYYPWHDEFLLREITSFKSYYCYNTTYSNINSIIELLLKTKTTNVVIIDEDNPEFKLTKDILNHINFVYSDLKTILSKNLDTNYTTIKWFLVDLLSQIHKTSIQIEDGSDDSERYHKKIKDNKFFEKIIFVDGGLGDHVMVLPLLEKLQDQIYVSCKYPFMFQHLKIKGFIDWMDPLFGGYSRFVYQYGSNNNTATIIDAFFQMYGIDRNKEDILKYNGVRDTNLIIDNKNKKICLICTSAAKIHGLDSNKDWRDIRWFKLVHELQKNNYYVIQVGTSKDNQIPRVDLKFLDKSISELAFLIDISDLWISVDTFFHHFAAAIKPDVGICLTPFYNDHAKHTGVRYIEKDCGKNYWERRWWLDLQQPERKECMDLIQVNDVVYEIKKRNLTIIQLGSNKGNDELTKFINKNGITIEKGIFVEPNPYHIDELKLCYKDHKNILIENIAIKPKKEDNSELEIFYHLNDEPHYEVASISKDHVAAHHSNDYENIRSFKIPAMTLEELLDKHNLYKIDWLLIDVEGVDAEIVENFNWKKYDINRIDIEHIHFGEKRDKIFELFYSLNYKHVVANDVRYDAAFEKK